MIQKSFLAGLEYMMLWYRYVCAHACVCVHMHMCVCVEERGMCNYV